MYRFNQDVLEVLLVHPGGPYWTNKDDGAWVAPRGGVEEGEDLFEAAKREFAEETGLTATGPFIPLGEVKHKSYKRVHCWAFEGDCDPTQLKSNTFKMEWPPKSGQWASFPEVDRAAFFTIDQAKVKMLPAEVPFLHRLREYLIRGTSTDVGAP